MTIRKSVLVLALAISAFSATQASAFFGYDDDRDPPKGLNGVSATGLTDQGLADLKVGKAAHSKSVVLPDGSRVEIK
ncbi:hypothetical protein [Microvirga terricola]|uniref:Uncharacterized protein n=1 Tax=Microvirga terricola TaxID=2719797 RepID=A0ABX0VE41_9HYPH|nr:hypothetical protein [Microvirga terricola]NIX76935.1 hypothetical protein [Microvirga terricola]